MAKRIKLTLQDGEWRPIKGLLKRRFPFLPYATAAKLILMQLAENKEPIDPTVTCGAFESPEVPSSHPESPEVPCPTHARARVHDDRQTDIQKEDTSTEQRVSDLLKALPWYGATLPKDDTPEQRAATLIASNPKVDIPAELARASEWLHDNPRKRKKRLGSFLASWMARATSNAQRPLFPTQSRNRRDHQDYSKRTPEDDPNDF